MSVKRAVQWEGRTYKVKSDKIDIPDLTAIPRMEAVVWMLHHTYPRGHSTTSNPNLAGLTLEIR